MKSYELSYIAKDTGANLSVSYHSPYLIKNWDLNNKSIIFVIGVWVSEAAFLAGKDIFKSYQVLIDNNHQIYNKITRKTKAYERKINKVISS